MRNNRDRARAHLIERTGKYGKEQAKEEIAEEDGEHVHLGRSPETHTICGAN